MRGSGRGRAALLGGALTLVAGAGTLGLGAATAAAWPGTGVVATDAALTTVILAGATAVAAWLAVVLATASVMVARARTDHGRGAASRALPHPVRLACAVLVTLAGSTSMPALAAPPGVVAVEDVLASAQPPVTSQPLTSSTTAPTDHGDRSVPQPGWTPTAPVPRPTAPDGVGLVSTQPHQTLPDQVVVRRGDTLWDIAARHLGPGASVADVATEWPRWYAENADAIGPDPDLIVPGLELTVPGRGTDR